MNHAGTDKPQMILNWLIRLPDLGPLGQFSFDELLQIRDELSGNMWEPATSDGLDDRTIKKIYKSLCGMGDKLRRGIPTIINGYRVQIPKGTGEVTVIPERGERQHELVLLETIVLSRDLLRRCKRCGKAFVRNRRQAYCTKKCSGSERIKNHRSNKIAKRVSTGSQP